MLLTCYALPDPWICPITWCLGIDPEGDACVEALVAGDYGWRPADQKVELEIGVPIPRD